MYALYGNKGFFYFVLKNLASYWKIWVKVCKTVDNSGDIVIKDSISSPLFFKVYPALSSKNPYFASYNKYFSVLNDFSNIQKSFTHLLGAISIEVYIFHYLILQMYHYMYELLHMKQNETRTTADLTLTSRRTLNAGILQIVVELLHY